MRKYRGEDWKKKVKPNPKINIMNQYKAKFQLTESIIWKISAIVGKRGRAYKKKNINGFVYTFNKYANYFGVDTKLEIRHFFSQLAHESDGFNAFREYASGRAYEGRKDLGNVRKGDGVKFKGRGPIQTTGRANYTEVGNEILKLPFLNEKEKAMFRNNGILLKPELLEDPVWGTLAAFIYWTKRDLNSLCRPDNHKVTIKRYKRRSGWYNYTCSPIEAITRKVNGGLNGFADRNKYYAKLGKVI